MATCTMCGQENPEIARFCLACGAPVADEPSAPRRVRKTVTVVFADVTGSTALGERLDPEQLQKVMARYFDEMRSILERHGGSVEKFIGDAVMAVFGIPTLHEDDALRAVRAATEMRDAMSSLELEARIGVNTGEVVAGGGETLVTGDAVNVAARLEQAAAPGEILLGEATCELVRDAVVLEPLAPLDLKGKEHPVAAFRLLELTVDAPARTRRLDSPMVGRETERRRLGDAFGQAVADRACQLFTVLGSAGVGKSRLVQEFLAETGEAATVLRGRCLPYGEGITFWPLVEAVRGAAGIGPADAPAEMRAKLVELVGAGSDAAAVSDRVAEVIGLAEAAGATEESFWGVRKLLEALARRRPLIVVFDDVHWAEPTFLDLVEDIAEWSRDAPILLLCMARAELLEERPAWGGGKVNATSVLLQPLSDEESASLFDNLVGAGGLADDVRARIADAAEGNPLFVEEMLRMLIDDGLLARRNDHWEPTQDLSDLRVPPTIQALLSARLDRLGGEERAVIERASVEGKVFHRGAVTELTPDAVRPAVGEHLRTLLRKDLVRPDHGAFIGEDAFRFHHLLVRDAAYESMPKELRADLHERFARWLESRVGEHANEYEEILGYHLEQAFRYHAELGAFDEERRSLAVEAANRLAGGGRRAAAVGDAPGAANLLRRADSLLAQVGRRSAELLCELGPRLFDAGELRAAEDALDAAVETAAAAGDRVTETRALVARSVIRLMTDLDAGADEALALAQEAIETFEALGDELGLADAWILVVRGNSKFALRARMEEAGEHALHHARRAGDRSRELNCLRGLATNMQWTPTPSSEALRRCEQILQEVRGSRVAEAGVLRVMGSLLGMQGRFDEGRELIRSGRGIVDDLGRPVDAAGTAFSGGALELDAGDAAAAERELRPACETLERLGEKGHLCSLATLLAEAIYRQGRYDEAEEWVAVSRQAAAADDLQAQSYSRAVQAKILALRGSLVEAVELGREAVSISARTDELNNRADILMSLGEILRLANRPDEAAEAIAEALGLYEQKENVAPAERARVLLEEL